MKTLLTLFTAGILAIPASANDNAEDLKTLSNVRTKDQTVNVYLDEAIEGATISILDQDESRIHIQKLKNLKDNLIIPYNLEALPTGVYKVLISTQESQISYTINNQNPAGPIENQPLKANAKKLDKNTVSLSVYGLSTSGVDVKIRKESSKELLHTEQIDTPNSFSKNFSFEGLDSEEIYFEVTDALGRTKEIHL